MWAHWLTAGLGLLCHEVADASGPKTCRSLVPSNHGDDGSDGDDAEDEDGDHGDDADDDDDYDDDDDHDDDDHHQDAKNTIIVVLVVMKNIGFTQMLGLMPNSST